MENAVVVENLTKEYRIYPTSFSRLKEALSFGRKKFHMAHRALDDVSLKIPKGQALGVIGENGAGKSTLLKILAGTTLPTGGRFEINGTVASLLELGTGFHSEFTGRANIYLAAQVQGFKLKEIEGKIDEIVEFAELGEYIDQPVRTYSSGMIMRLGFSVATAIDPEVLIIDEILAVGDLYFQKKCIDRIFDFRKAGKSILFCTHALYDVRQVCDEVIWIKDGRIEQQGMPQDVTVSYANYERALTADPEIATVGKEKITELERPPVITEVRLLLDDGNDGVPIDGPVEPGVDLMVDLDFLIRKRDRGVHLGIAIFRPDNVLVASFISTLNDVPAVFDEGSHRCRLKVPDLRLLEGEYNIVGYLLDETGVHFYDHRQLDESLLVSHEENQPGVVRLDHEFHVYPMDGSS